MEEFESVMQIASEEKPSFMIGDNGTCIYRSTTDDEWYLNWDCY
ncbi:hypothetical protein [Paenibacillus alvei]|nr:hypothetical protein [Paenibacillus alvei]EPY11343.1 hypothetical protein PAAL66ix_18037 [Paenibacillus alvei A6-6i-x]